MTQHKWSKEIKAWADGADIQIKYPDTDWQDTVPNWYLTKENMNAEYRIKPQPKEPQYLYVTDGMKGIEFHREKQYLENPAQYNIGKIKLETDDGNA